MAKEINRKAAAGRKAAPKPKGNTNAARRVSTGGTGGWGGPNISRQNLPGQSNYAPGTPSYQTPSALGAVTPIAAPPVITDPFLTPTDLANQALELADVSGYLANVHKQTTDAQIAAQQRQQEVNTAEQRNLEAADWNTAARGLAQSSVRDTTKANLSADAQAARSGTEQMLANQQGYEAGEVKRGADATAAINKKYTELAGQNAQALTDATGAPATADTGTAAPAPAVPTGGAPQKGITAPFTSTGPTVTGQTAQPTTGGYKPVVKDGRFYHVYPDGRWVYIRPAG